LAISKAALLTEPASMRRIHDPAGCFDDDGYTFAYRFERPVPTVFITPFFAMVEMMTLKRWRNILAFSDVGVIDSAASAEKTNHRLALVLGT
jgi:hypothetical protein